METKEERKIGGGGREETEILDSSRFPRRREIECNVTGNYTCPGGRGIIVDINMTVTYIMRVSRAHCTSQSWIIITRGRSTSAVARASINAIKVTLLPTEQVTG